VKYMESDMRINPDGYTKEELVAYGVDKPTRETVRVPGR